MQCPGSCNPDLNKYSVQPIESIQLCIDVILLNDILNRRYQFNFNLSQQHLKSPKHILYYLKHISSHGIWFKQGENWLYGSVAIPEELKGNKLEIFTDSNWDPQDVSKRKLNKPCTVIMEELKSI